ncbi:hypothetical protein JCM19238_4018 [Vibrio ponticus]|nr:hypothetical protein JCM19238_4018 [Vibrio ponticus]
MIFEASQLRGFLHRGNHKVASMPVQQVEFKTFESNNKEHKVCVWLPVSQ